LIFPSSPCRDFLLEEKENNKQTICQEFSSSQLLEERVGVRSVCIKKATPKGCFS